ncbi:MAG: holo-ACP synthase [Candidatus Margulisiibacteriota bacterium]
MIKGIGIDIIEIDRIKDAVEKYGENFLKKVFTEKEIKYCRRRKTYRIPELAVRFAAKEAYSKAIGTGITGFGRKNNGVKWTDIEIKNDSLGKPLILIKGKMSKNAHVSLSHSRDYAVAAVYVGD